jgi:hypothetical protein
MPGERRFVLPTWCTLTDEEIGAALALLSQRKREDEAGFVITESGMPEWYTLSVPVNCALRRDDIITILNVTNRAAAEKHADATIKFQDGVVVTKNITLKPEALDRDAHRLRIGGPRISGW